MRARRWMLVGLSLAGIPAGAACVDLFHDTDLIPDFADAASSPEADTDSRGPAPPIELCALTPEQAKTRAIRGCALLAACEKPVGGNATGRCLENALPAMDCIGAPSRRPRGAALDFYRCLAGAQTCDDIARCVLRSDERKPCGQTSTGYVRCGGHDDTRWACTDSGAPFAAEPCFATGQTCWPDDDAGRPGRCAGSYGISQCTKTGCTDTHLHLCSDAGVDEGFDCAAVGAGRCIDGDGGIGPACAPPDSGTPCVPSGVVQCSGSVATGCPAGEVEILDCAMFSSACHSIAADAGAALTNRRNVWDIARACDAGACTTDSCSGSKLSACVHGTFMQIDCAAVTSSQSKCDPAVVTTDGPRAACARPSN